MLRCPLVILFQVLWLLSFDDDKNTLADAVDKYCIGVPPIQWLAWIPQLLTCLVGSEGKLLLNLISQVQKLTVSSLIACNLCFQDEVQSKLRECQALECHCLQQLVSLNKL